MVKLPAMDAIDRPRSEWIATVWAGWRLVLASLKSPLDGSRGASANGRRGM